jgi:hypothetical protein
LFLALQCSLFRLAKCFVCPGAIPGSVASKETVGRKTSSAVGKPGRKRQKAKKFMERVFIGASRAGGHAGGSKGLATQIKEGSLRGDVFISADPKVNALLSGPVTGSSGTLLSLSRLSFWA